MSSAHEKNRRAWDALVRKKNRFASPAKDDQFADPLRLLDGSNWLEGDIRDKRVLCLAAGGGRQGPLYAAAGGSVTVVDISPAQLVLDRQVASERGLSLRTVEASMDDLSMFEPGEFEIVIHPVSSCYLPNIGDIYGQVARVTQRGGIYISQHKQPTSLQTETRPSGEGYRLLLPYYRADPLPQVQGSLFREDGTVEYLHRWEQLIGGLCRAGFAVEDLTEPLHMKPNAPVGSFAHRSAFVAPYVRIKARRTGSDQPGKSKRMWIPG